MKIHEWFANRKKAREEEDYDNGWDYAAGELLRGTDLDKRLDAVRMPLGTPFDRGILDAIRTWNDIKMKI